MTEVSRRRFLTGSTLAIAVVAVAGPPEIAAVGQAPDARDLFDDPNGVRALGRRAIDDGHSADLATEVSGRDAAALRAAIAEDVATGRCITVGGWTLARTEVALSVHEYLRSG